MVRIWKRFAGTSATRLSSLPPIVPVVVYHGAPDWTVPGSLRDMIAADDPELAFLPGSGYILRNLRTMDIDAAVAERPRSGPGSSRCGGRPWTSWRRSRRACRRAAT